MTCNIKAIDKKINDAINKYCMFDSKKAVIIGVSGGADSMTLLKFFIEYSKNCDVKIIAAHVNHCLRGEESDRDENFVREYCKANDVNFEVLRIDVNKEAELAGEGIEECARKIRYKFFNNLAMKYNGLIATAHTMSDSIETMIINLVRGTGMAGLCGIPPKRDNIIRPLIFLKRTETQNYCLEYNISYVTDSTNLKREYTRNKIRLDVIPILKQINPEFEDTVSRTISILKSDEEYLIQTAEDILNKSLISHGEYILNDISKQPLPILSRCIRGAVSEFIKSNITANHVELISDIIKSGNGAVILPKDIKVSVNKNILKIEKNYKTKKLNDFKIPFKEGKILTEHSGKFIIKIVDREQYNKFNKVNNLLFFYALSYDTITGETFFRNRRPGDKFCKSGRGVTKTIKKLFNELKIPEKNRDKVLMLANENEILWIDNVGVSESAKIKETTKKIVLICLKEN